MSLSTATVTRLVKAERAVEGDGFVVRRPFPTSSLSYIDPFLLFDHMGPVEFAPGEGTGARSYRSAWIRGAREATARRRGVAVCLVL